MAELASGVEIQPEIQGARCTLRLSGTLGGQDLPELAETCRSALHSGARDFLLDLGSVQSIDISGAAALLECLDQIRQSGARHRFGALSESAKNLFSLVEFDRLSAKARPPAPKPETLLERMGGQTLRFLEDYYDFSVVVCKSLYWTLLAPLQGKGLKFDLTLRQIVQGGLEALPIVGLLGFLVGVTTALNAVDQLRQLGASIFIADLVAVGMARELGPLIAGVIVTGRTGAAIAAEIGTMRITEEIDALQTMGVNPYRYLIVPRVLSLLVALPILTLFCDLVGILGGYLLGTVYFGLGSELYWKHTTQALLLTDVLTGLAKSLAFGGIIGIVGCYKGMQVKGGAEGVGRATTAAVVVSILLIILADCFFAALSYLVGTVVPLEQRMNY